MLLKPRVECIRLKLYILQLSQNDLKKTDEQKAGGFTLGYLPLNSSVVTVILSQLSLGAAPLTPLKTARLCALNTL